MGGNVTYWYLHSIMFLFQWQLFWFVRICGTAFTFHYVSISMGIDRSHISVLLHLHSIMFLFQSIFPRSFAPIFLFTFHYVSISISQPFFECLPGFKFTFHYVSISIRPVFPRSASLLFYHFLSTSSIAHILFCIFDSIFVQSMPFSLFFLHF